MAVVEEFEVLVVCSLSILMLAKFNISAYNYDDLLVLLIKLKKEF